MIELDDDTLQDIREGALPGVRFYRDSWDQELLFEAPETIEEFRGLERREVSRIEADGGAGNSAPGQVNISANNAEKLPAAGFPARPRKRKPSLHKLIAAAKAAGASSVVVEGVEMRFGEPAVEQTNDLDKWMAKRHAH